MKITAAKKYTAQYYLEKYADYLVDTPPDGGYMSLIDSDENGKQVMRYLSFDYVPEDDFYQGSDNYTNEQVTDGGIIRWNGNCPITAPNTQSTNSGAVCGNSNCQTHSHHNYNHSGHHHNLTVLGW